MQRSRRHRVVAVQHVAEEPPALIASALAAAGIDLAVVRAHAGEKVPASAEGVDGLLVLGGPMAVYEAERHPHLRDEMRLIESVLARGAPVLGVCLGGQLLAAVLGARVEKGPRKEIGWFPVALEPAAAEDPLFAPLPASFTALHWHGDVFELPRGATHLARSELTRHQAFRHGKSAYGILFHAEWTRQQLAAIATAFDEELEEAGVSRDALLRGAKAHGAELERLGLSLYGRWARLVTGGR